MANEVLLPQLTSSVRIGKAMFFVGDYLTANSWSAPGMVQGPITAPHGTTFSDLRLEDQTGPMMLDRLVMGQDLSVRVPLVMPKNNSIQTIISPTGSRGFGSSNPSDPPTTSVAIIPTLEVGGGLKFASGAWSRLAGGGVAAAPAHTITASGTNSLGATSLTVSTTLGPIRSGARMVFASGKVAVSTAATATGVTTIPVAALAAAITAADTALVSGDGAPYNALWLWRCTIDYDEQSFSIDAGGRQISTVTAQALFSFDTGLVDGMKLGYKGNPMDAAVPPTTFHFSST